MLTKNSPQIHHILLRMHQGGAEDRLLELGIK